MGKTKNKITSKVKIMSSSSRACPNCCSNITKRDGKFDNLVVCSTLANSGNTRVGVLDVNRLNVGALFVENILGTFETDGEPLISDVDTTAYPNGTFEGNVFRFGNVGFVSFTFNPNAPVPFQPLNVRLGQISDPFFFPSETIFAAGTGGSGFGGESKMFSVDTDGTIRIVNTFFAPPTSRDILANQLYITN
jgi:hypothetical protein